jgi:hypothetical protein
MPEVKGGGKKERRHVVVIERHQKTGLKGCSDKWPEGDGTIYLRADRSTKLF